MAAEGPGPLVRAVRTDLDHLGVERGLAANTLTSYRRDLRRYLGYLDSQGIADLDAVTEQTVLGFLMRGGTASSYFFRRTPIAYYMPTIAALSVILIIITVLVLAVRSVMTRQRAGH